MAEKGEGQMGAHSYLWRRWGGMALSVAMALGVGLGFGPGIGLGAVAQDAAGRSAGTDGGSMGAARGGVSHILREERRSIWLERLTWVEARALLPAPETVVVVPVGSVQARGPHLALGARNALLMSIVGAAGEADGQTLIAPLIPVGPQMDEDGQGGLRWPGTLHGSPQTVAALVAEVITSLKVHGASRILLVAHDRETLEALGDTVTGLNRLWAEQGVRLAVVEKLIDPLHERTLLGQLGIKEEEPFARGGALETSEILSCCAQMVRIGHIPRTSDAVASSGAEGRPHLARPEIGARSIKAKQDVVLTAIRALRES